MIRIIISLNNLVVYVSNINCILSSPAWICFGYKVIITAGVDMAYVICGAEVVTIKKKSSFFIYMTRINVWFNVSFTDFDPICLK